MKKFTFITAALILFGAITAIAQPAQGRLMLSASSTMNIFGLSDGINLGSMTLSKQKVKSDNKDFEESQNQSNDTYRTINFAPKVGYLVVDNIAVGLGYSFLNFYQEYSTDNFTSTDNTTMNVVSPFIRLYAPVSGVSLFADVEGGLGYLKNTSETDYINSNSLDRESESTDWVTSLNLSLGMAVPLSDRINFDFAVVYNRLTVKEKEDNPDNTRYINISYGAKLGFTFFLFN